MTEKLRVGKIPYMNLYPIFHILETECDTKDYEIIEGYPSALNRKLRGGELDVSPSSSIEYLKDEKTYTLIEGHSISSFGPIESIVLFSRVPIESLDGHTIYATSHSDTSVALLRVILRKFYKINCTIKISDHPIIDAIKAHSASMSIGDEALLSAKGYLPIDLSGSGQKFASIDRNSFFIYDLGELWHNHTGLPFVFALWITRKDSLEKKRAIFEKFRKDLDFAKRKALDGLEGIAAASNTVMPVEELVSYWKKISYDLGDEHMQGLALFKKYLVELDIIAGE